MISVLLIETTTTLHANTSSALSSAGYQLFTLSSPIGATRTIFSHDIAAVVIDLYDAGAAGARLVKVLRKNPVLSRLVIVALLDPQGVEEAKTLGVLDDVDAVVDRRDVSIELAQVLARSIARRRPTAERDVGAPSRAR